MSKQAYIVIEGRLVREASGWSVGEDDGELFGPVCDLAEARREYDERSPRWTFELERSARGGLRRMAAAGYYVSIERVEVDEDGGIEHLDTVETKSWSADDEREMEAAWHGEGWYRVSYSDGDAGEPAWCDVYESVAGAYEAAAEQASDIRLPLVDWMGDGDAPEEDAD